VFLQLQRSGDGIPATPAFIPTGFDMDAYTHNMEAAYTVGWFAPAGYRGTSSFESGGGTVVSRNSSVAVIGAGDYIGAAIARKFAAEGFTVFAGRRAARSSSRISLRSKRQAAEQSPIAWFEKSQAKITGGES
jgi:hypothetical protein